MNTSDPISVRLLADLPDLVPAVGKLRWQEWGHEPGRTALSWWVEVTGREAGRDGLPVTFVAVDRHGEAVGAAGLAAAVRLLPSRTPAWYGTQAAAAAVLAVLATTGPLLLLPAVLGTAAAATWHERRQTPALV
jgi:hypothetical protein